MEIFLNRTKYNRLYSCDALSTSEWEKYSVRQANVTVPCLILGTTYLLMYIPCMFVLFKRQFFRKPCYKLMFLLGLLDISLTINTLIYGVLYAEGVIFCLAPSLHFILGVITQTCWVGQCLTTAILIVVSTIDAFSKSLSARLFGGSRTFLFYGIIAIYMAYFALFAKPLIFSPSTIIPSYDPYASLPQSVIHIDRKEYFNIQALANNIVFLVVLLCSFTALVIVLRRTKIEVHRKVQMKAIRQSGFICTLNIIPSAFFIAAQFVSVPWQWAFLFLFTWQMAIGVRGFMMLCVNRSIRQAYFGIIFFHSKNSKTASVEPIRSNWI
ncbi:hypothetical protein QR680_015932 [Steinernema hermaphroditum]|uniref:Uncharacterized protein n=1 Tax=Steinernema hermaphroditum TaxID=289476 RepID=A0AA39HAI0_9BILA|nr:hypothetical protein QR680_015932 [Steinernema hermaphroditum]